MSIELDGLILGGNEFNTWSSDRERSTRYQDRNRKTQRIDSGAVFILNRAIQCNVLQSWRMQRMLHGYNRL